ncbi:hypothetical protein [Novosphingobium sp. 9U]|nr:hypothetical protein [Novosphingobium sp. 9U]VWX48910.1 hypothetical protein NOVOSPHI9U_20147 [Novosphingobium sp. 9U]
MANKARDAVVLESGAAGLTAALTAAVSTAPRRSGLSALAAAAAPA